MHDRTSAGGWTRPCSVPAGLETPLAEAERPRLERGECDLELADSAVAFAMLTLVDPDSTLTMIEFNIRFLAP